MNIHVLLLLLIWFAAVTSGDAVAKESISVMTYNVENLFDTTHDSGKNDYTFLPVAVKRQQNIESHCKNVPAPAWKKQCLNMDWNRQTLNTKLARLADVIKKSSSEGAPDILVLEEVENISVLRELVEKYLSSERYLSPILIEGTDYRGIDTAILSRFALANKPILIPIPLVNFGKTRKESIRAILSATFLVSKSDLLTVFGVHFPSPQKSWTLRRQAMNFLNLQALKLPQNRTVLAAGDFNNSSKEEEEFGLFQKYARPTWFVSHLDGCKLCSGTHYHAATKSWSFLDAIMIYRSRQSPWKLMPSSVHIVRNSAFQTDNQGHPVRFSADDSTGVSDHLPVALTLGRSQ
jgi:endonuclease/exonuclease/phosphatase family metal-dependent hydrolase